MNSNPNPQIYISLSLSLSLSLYIYIYRLSNAFSLNCFLFTVLVYLHMTVSPCQQTEVKGQATCVLLTASSASQSLIHTLQRQRAESTSARPAKENTDRAEVLERKARRQSGFSSPSPWFISSLPFLPHRPLSPRLLPIL